MNDRTRSDEQRRQSGPQSTQQSGWENGNSQSWQQQDRGRYGAGQNRSGFSGPQNAGGQQGGWNDDNRHQQHQRDMSHSGDQSGRSWGDSGHQGGQQGGWGQDEANNGQPGYGDSRNRADGRDWGGSDQRGPDRDNDWNTRDNWRNPGSQSFAADYGMRDGQDYDERFRREGFGASGGQSNPTFGRGYGPDYGRDRSDNQHRSDDYRGGQRDRGFLERAGDEIASWFGAGDDADRNRDGQPGGSSGQSWRGHGPSDYTRSDERIREDVNDHLTDDPRVDARQISVAVDKGEVTLTGTVANREVKRRAEDLIDRISGVKHVQNNLRITQSASQPSSHSTATSPWQATANTLAGADKTAENSSGVTGASATTGSASAATSATPSTGSSATRKDS
jgi:hypothetical protein